MVAEPLSRSDRLLLVATYLLVTGVGVLLGVIGTFLVPLRVGGVAGLSIAIAVVGNAVAGLLGGVGTGTTLGAVLPGAGWFVATGVFTVFSPGGDVVIPGTLAADPGIAQVGTGYLVVGVVAAVAAMVVTIRWARRAGRPPSGAVSVGDAAAPSTRP